MKKQLLIISILVVIVSIFVSCSVSSSSKTVSTTAVTDSNGITHYYEPKCNVSTTGKNQGVYAEIETNSDGKVVTNKNGIYVTNDHTTVLPIKDDIAKPSIITKPTTEKLSSSTTKHNDDTNADNIVEFEHKKPTDGIKSISPVTTTTEKRTTTTTTETTTTETTTTEKRTTTTTTETTTQKTTQPITDKDGWINKWY